jgi:hypothetical protein
VTSCVSSRCCTRAGTRRRSRCLQGRCSQLDRSAGRRSSATRRAQRARPSARRRRARRGGDVPRDGWRLAGGVRSSGANNECCEGKALRIPWRFTRISQSVSVFHSTPVTMPAASQSASNAPALETPSSSPIPGHGATGNGPDLSWSSSRMAIR